MNELSVLAQLNHFHLLGAMGYDTSIEMFFNVFTLVRLVGFDNAVTP